MKNNENESVSTSSSRLLRNDSCTSCLVKITAFFINLLSNIVVEQQMPSSRQIHHRSIIT
jgi:hypothetical protein